MKKKHLNTEGKKAIISGQSIPADMDEHLRNFISGDKPLHAEVSDTLGSNPNEEMLGEDFYHGITTFVREHLSGEPLPPVECILDERFSSVLFPESGPQDPKELRAAAESFRKDGHTHAAASPGKTSFPIAPFLQAELYIDGGVLFLTFVSNDERLVNRGANIEIQLASLEVVQHQTVFRQAAAAISSGEITLAAEDMIYAKMLIRFD